MTAGRIHITQGERAASADPTLSIATILGSCVTCCLWDPVAAVGGMNHMLLAVSGARQSMSNLAGINAMELLINDLLKIGGRRDRLRAKAFGGARMIAGTREIGRINGEFALNFLEQEGIACLGHSLGGVKARHVIFWPTTGRVLQKFGNDVPAEPRTALPPKPVAGNDLELF